MRAIALVVIAGCGRVGFAPTSDAADDVYVPPDIVVQPGCSATSVGVGELHTCVLVENGTTYCTGENAFAQLGVGSVTANVETPVVATRITGASTLHAGRGFTCSVDAGGVVSCLGINANRQCGAQVPGPVLDGINPTGLPPIQQLATGYSSACATTTAGDVYCWGDGDEGQAGNGTDPGTHIPEVVPALAGMSPTTALGTSHVCATVPSGVVSCWGDATDLRIGVVGPDTCANASAGSIECAMQPTTVAVPAMKSVATGDEHSCVLTQASGEVWCWGANDQGQVGVARSPSEMPQRIGTLTGITQLALGKDHTCVLDAAGAVQCWGDNVRLQLGYTGNDSVTPIDVVLPEPATSLHAGPSGYHTCAILAGGTVWCWGEGSDGQLGRGPQVGGGVPSPMLLPCP